MQKIKPPTSCPSCLGELEWRKDILYCINDSCGDRVEKSIEHWAKTLKIKGLGPKAITKLGLNSALDLYWLSPQCIKDCLGSEKVAIKLYDEIQKSRSASLNKVLPAFGIPLIGNSATGKLCAIINSIDEITKRKAIEAGLGPKATSNLLDWFEGKYKNEIKDNLDFTPTTEARIVTNVPKLGIVCISGKLKTFKTKSEAETQLIKLGYIVKSSLTKDVTILINESGDESAKTKKARDNGIPIITDLKTMIGE